MAYCDLADLFSHGVSRGALRNAGRLVGSVDTSANTIELDVHGFATGDAVSFRADASGSLPSPLASGTAYYAINVDEGHFSVAATSGGVAIDLTTAGSRTVVIAPLPESAAREWATRVVDDMLPSGVVPLTAPYPEIVRMTCAELAAWKLLAMKGEVSRSFAEIADAAQRRLARWAKGVPIRGDNAPAAAGLSAKSSTATAAAVFDVRGWRTYGAL